LVVFGDSAFKWFETRSGYVVVENSDSGFYEFAVVADDSGKPSLTPSGVAVTGLMPDEAHKVNFARHADSVKIRMEVQK